MPLKIHAQVLWYFYQKLFHFLCVTSSWFYQYRFLPHISPISVLFLRVVFLPAVPSTFKRSLLVSTSICSITNLDNHSHLVSYCLVSMQMCFLFACYFDHKYTQVPSLQSSFQMLNQLNLSLMIRIRLNHHFVSLYLHLKSDVWNEASLTSVSN